MLSHADGDGCRLGGGPSALAEETLDSFRETIILRIGNSAVGSQLMKYSLSCVAAALALASIASQASAASCAASAADKKLAGAAKTSFMTKCTKDATANCEQSAADKKLAGAAKTSFVKKCAADAG